MLQPLARSIRGYVARVAKGLGIVDFGAPSPKTFSEYIFKLAKSAADPKPLNAAFVSLVVPVFNTPPSYLDELVASVRIQRNGAWELILSDDGSSDPGTLRWLDRHARDSDLKILRNLSNRGVVAATNAGIMAASSPWLGFLDHDDALAPHALDQVWRALSKRPGCEFLYTDEIIADAAMRPVDFFLKPAFDPVLLSGVNYLNHLSLYRRERLLALGGLREGFEGSQDYDLVLRYTRGLERAQCMHIPYPAYVWRRDGVSYSAKFMERATLNARRALAETYTEAGRVPLVDAANGNLHRIRFDAGRDDWPLVSVVIPNRDALALISEVLRGLLDSTDYPRLEVWVIDNGTTDPSVLDLYRRRAEGAIPFKAIVEPEAFNFSRAINKGIAHARGDFVLWLNNDIEIVDPGWLKEMVSCFNYPDVGIVGAKLLYPDQTLQHAGVIVGFGDLAGHWYLEKPKEFPGPMGRLWVRQSLSSVTGACLLVSRECLAVLGSLDEEKFAIAYNDVDFCMRALGAGFRVVWTPFATLIHLESASRGSDETVANIDRFHREQDNLRAAHATASYEDPAVSPWYTKDRSCPSWARLSKLPLPR